MMSRFLLASLLLVALVASRASAQCSFAGHDLSSLGASDISGSDGGGVYTYYVNVCGVLKTQPTCSALSQYSSSCQVQVNPKGGSYDTGNWGMPGTPPAVWGYVNGENAQAGIMYQMQGAASCWATGSPTDYFTNVLFVCGAAGVPMTVINPKLSCTQNLTITTPLACAGGGGGGGGSPKKGGLSGGWIFIILLCVCIPLYVVLGCVYKSQRLGTSGVDNCPQVEFWRDLPSLCKDGCVFTYTKLRGLCGGGGGGAKEGSNYETM